jgi:transposase
LYMALELSNTKWKVGFSNGERIRQVTITARDLGELEDEIEKARKRFCLKDDVQIVSCYEAGRDGFWIHRYLTDRGIENLVVDSSSIEVNRRSRRAKTDRLDLRSLVRMFIRYCGGERGLWSVVQEPSVEDEDARRLHRELERLKKERASHSSRIRSLLILHGIILKEWKDFPECLGLLKTGDGHLLPSGIKSEIEREFFRMKFLEQQIKELEAEQMERIQNPQTESDKKIKAFGGSHQRIRFFVCVGLCGSVCV